MKKALSLIALPLTLCMLFGSYSVLVGIKKILACSSCGAENPFSFIYCNECGALFNQKADAPSQNRNNDTFTYEEILQMTNSCPETTNAGIYPCYYYDDENPSGWEFWPFIETGEVDIKDFSRFHLCVAIDPLAFDAGKGLSFYGNDGHPYTWKVFYSDLSSNDKFRMVECQPWSAGGYWTINEEYHTIYRLPLMDYGMEKLFDDGIYEMFFVIYDKNDNVACWFERDVEWNAASNAYYEEAYSRGYIRG